MPEIFIKSENTRTTRSTDETKLFIPLRRNEYWKNCLSYLGAMIWNSINSTIRKLKLATHSNIRLRTNISVILNKKRAIYTITG